MSMAAIETVVAIEQVDAPDPAVHPALSNEADKGHIFRNHPVRHRVRMVTANAFYKQRCIGQAQEKP
jgi:hypothetical protein